MRSDQPTNRTRSPALTNDATMFTARISFGVPGAPDISRTDPLETPPDKSRSRGAHKVDTLAFISLLLDKLDSRTVCVSGRVDLGSVRVLCEYISARNVERGISSSSRYRERTVHKKENPP